MLVVLDYFILQIQFGLVIVVIIVVVVGNGMFGLCGIVVKWVKGCCVVGVGLQVVVEVMIFGVEDQGVCQVVCIEIGVQVVIG